MLMECGPSNCGFPNCGNRPFADSEAGRLDDLSEVFWTGQRKGFGLRAATGLRKNQLVAEYLGEIVSQSSIHNWRYIMSLPQVFAIDASVAGGPARFINHSCEPNCNAQRWLVEGRWHVGIFASRDILPREELTFSYSNGRGSRGSGFGSSDPCHCGAHRCSGRIAEPPKKYGRAKKMKAVKDKSKKDKKVSVFRRPKSGGFRASKSSNNSGRFQKADPASENLKNPPDQSPSSIIVEADLPSADRTGVVEVEDDLIELSDDHDLHHDALDEEETLQDLLAAKAESHSEPKQVKMGSQVTAGMLKATWQCFPKDHEENEEITADTAVSLGLYLPSALHRAREFLCKR